MFLNTLEPQQDDQGRMFRQVSVTMSIKQKPKWINNVLKHRWVFRFKYLYPENEDSSIGFDVYVDYDDSIVAKKELYEW